MNVLLTESFSVESKEAKELINEIKTSFENQDKEAFLNSKKPVVDAGYAATSKEEETIYNHNVYKILQELPILTSFAFVQTLIQERRDNKPFNDILGNSDEIFVMLKDYSNEADENGNEEVAKIKKGEAFYH